MKRFFEMKPYVRSLSACSGAPERSVLLTGGLENKVLPQKIEPFDLSSSSHSKIETSRHSSSSTTVINYRRVPTEGYHIPLA
jgi:hypothetical protein